MIGYKIGDIPNLEIKQNNKNHFELNYDDFCTLFELIKEKAYEDGKNALK